MRKIGTISCVEASSNPTNAKSSSGQTAPLHAILFHGYGADAYDLQSLSEVIRPKENATWLFPQGIISVPIGPGWTGRAWWPIDIARLESANRAGGFDLANTRPEGLDELRIRIDEMVEKLGVPWSRILVGGFSQGAMLATDTFLRAKENPYGLMILSGALINKEEWKKNLPARSGCKFFMCHGKHDMVLPYRGASQLESLLNGGGLKGSLFTFEGGHEIPMAAMEKANQWLQSF